LLFYIRKDVIGKGVDYLMPNIETQLFPGKPVTVIGNPPQDGFITEVIDDANFMVKCKNLIVPRRVT
jgi:hypothetical protein